MVDFGTSKVTCDLLAVHGWGMYSSIMLEKVLGQVDRSGLNCARNIQLGVMDTNVLGKP